MYTLIQGTYYMVGTPDADSIKFRANNAAHWAQIRTDNHKQPIRFGELATNTFLEFMGVTKVKWRRWGRSTWIDEAPSQGNRVTDKGADAIPGYIITDDVERNGRPLSWVFNVTEAETLGQLLYDLGNGQWNIPELRQRLTEVIPQEKAVRGYRVRHSFPSLGPRTMRLKARQIASHQRILLVLAELSEDGG
ncbi:MAG: hypothetical protein HC915_15455 [Anaerolineae bacterium]|nr:hypothetical protein [Anaerolineae bacterium]